MSARTVARIADAACWTKAYLALAAKFPLFVICDVAAKAEAWADRALVKLQAPVDHADFRGIARSLRAEGSEWTS